VPSDRLVGRGHRPGAQETDGLRPRRLPDGPLVIVGIVCDKPVGCRGDGRGAGARAVPGASTTPSTRLSSDGPALLIARPLAGICVGGSPRTPPPAAAAGGEADPPPITAPAAEATAGGEGRCYDPRQLRPRRRPPAHPPPLVGGGRSGGGSGRWWHRHGPRGRRIGLFAAAEDSWGRRAAAS